MLYVNFYLNLLAVNGGMFSSSSNACMLDDPFLRPVRRSQVFENSDLLLRNDANADLLEIHLENVVVTFEFSRQMDLVGREGFFCHFCPPSLVSFFSFFFLCSIWGTNDGRAIWSCKFKFYYYEQC